MDEIIMMLMKRMNELDQVIQEAEGFMKKAPSGTLRISTNNGKDQYYWRNDPKDTRGTYLNKSKEKLIYNLAQKEYTKKLLSAANEEKKCMEQFLNKYHPEKKIDVFIELSSTRKKIVRPYVLSEEEYATQWQKETYTKSRVLQESESEIITEKGELVRSKSEKILADKFNAMHIPYHYEKPLNLDGYGVVYPDFIVLNKRTRKEYYWEHFGLMNDTSYCDKAIKKIETMQKNGIYPGDKLILTYETQNHTINMRIVDGLIHNYLF